MRAIDTSLLYALFNEADQWHGEARRAVQEHRPIVVPPGILQETLDLLAYRHGVVAARRALEWMEREDGFILADSRAHQQAIPLFLDDGFDRKKRSLSFADAWCVAHAREAGIPLLTKDRHQETALGV